LVFCAISYPDRQTRKKHFDAIQQDDNPMRFVQVGMLP
jgi:hypothetical protein